MTTDLDELAALMAGIQGELVVADDRLQLGALSWRDMNLITGLCLLVAKQASAGNTVRDMVLERLACTTAAVLTTAVVDGPDNASIVAEWRQADHEYRALAARSRGFRVDNIRGLPAAPPMDVTRCCAGTSAPVANSTAKVPM